MIALIPYEVLEKALQTALYKSYGKLLKEHEYTTEGESPEKSFVREEHANLGKCQTKAVLVRMKLPGGPVVEHNRSFDLKPLCFDDGVSQRKSV